MAERNRIQKTLEGAGIKLGSVASDVLGSSGRLMIEALVDGSTDAATMADLAKGNLRAKGGKVVPLSVELGVATGLVPSSENESPVETGLAPSQISLPSSDARQAASLQ